MEVISSEGWTDQMEEKTSWTPGCPLRYQSDGCWLEPHWTVMPDLNSPGQLLSVQLAGSDLSIPEPLLVPVISRIYSLVIKREL